MDQSSLIFAALAGGIGGLLGGIVAAILTSEKTKTAIQVICVVGGVSLAGIYLKPVLEIEFGNQVRAYLGEEDKDILVEFEREMRKNPMINRMLDDYPNEIDLSRDALIKAEAKGNAALRQEAQRVGFELGQTLMPRYLPLAQEDDLIAFADVTSQIVLALSDEDPMLCTAWLFGAMNGQTFDVDDLGETLGAAKMDQMMEVSTSLVVNAGSVAPAYDQSVVDLLMPEIAQVMIAEAGPQGLDVIANGVPPETEEIAKAACNGTGVLYQDIVARDREEAIAVLRSMFASQ